jgi:hypothetical protein
MRTNGRGHFSSQKMGSFCPILFLASEGGWRGREEYFVLCTGSRATLPLAWAEL